MQPGGFMATNNFASRTIHIKSLMKGARRKAAPWISSSEEFSGSA
jgi:hypothetical protein